MSSPRLATASGWLSAGGACIWLAIAALPDPAAASCNVIPGTTNQFRGALGAVDRPFAMPGDVVEVTLRPEVCDQHSRGLRDFDGRSGVAPDDLVVTVLFEPPAGPRNAVVMTPRCDEALESSLAACVPLENSVQPVDPQKG